MSIWEFLDRAISVLMAASLCVLLLALWRLYSEVTPDPSRMRLRIVEPPAAGPRPATAWPRHRQTLGPERSPGRSAPPCVRA